jgi:hypothetical protein
MDKHQEVFIDVGLLVNEPPGWAGLPFIKSSEICCRTGHKRPSRSNDYSIHDRLAKGSRMLEMQVLSSVFFPVPLYLAPGLDRSPAQPAMRDFFRQAWGLYPPFFATT